MRGRAKLGGFTLVEVLIVALIFLFAISLLAQTVGALMEVGPLNQENSVAVEAARSAAERIRAQPPEQIFRLYNADPADDPGGAGTAPGPNFAVSGLDVRDDDPDGFAGQVQFPTLGGELREDVVDRALGSPRDLDGDGHIDGLDKGAGDYVVLPFRVRIEWNGRRGARTFDHYSAIASP